MRLTVHLKGVKKKRIEVPNKQGKGTEQKEKLFNTVNFDINNESEVEGILNKMENERQTSILERNFDPGQYASHYIYGETIPGRPRTKKGAKREKKSKKK